MQKNFSRHIKDQFLLQDKTYQVIAKPFRENCDGCDLQFPKCCSFSDITGCCSYHDRVTEVKITIPEGMEIDKENSTFECIKFKPIDTRIKSLEEYLKHYPYKQKDLDNLSKYLGGSAFFTAQEIRQFIAWIKLRSLWETWLTEDQKKRRATNSYFTPDYDGEDWCISQSSLTGAGFHLHFPTTQMCREFIDCFQYLLNH